MTLATAIVITLIALAFSGLFSGSEIAFVQSSKVKMEIQAAKGGVIDRIIHGFCAHEDMFISTLLVGNNIVLVIYGITFTYLINPILETWIQSEAVVLICNTLLSTGVVLVMGEMLPKSIFRINPNSMLRVVAFPLYLIYIVLYPLSLLVSAISKGLMRLFGMGEEEASDQRLSIEEINDYLEQQIDNGNPKEVENEVKIFRNAIDFKDTQISECMIPRNEIVGVDVHATSRETLLNLFSKTGLSKIVVYNDDIDDVVGYIHVAEMFNLTDEWTRHIRKVIFTPETMLANKMMSRMLSEKRSLAIVVDEFGGTAGLATLEDLVEEIFGEIEDEHDPNQTLLKRISENEFEISGRAEIEYLDEECGLDIRQSDEYHTLAGYILENLEQFPHEGDVFDIGRLQFTILRMSTTKIELVKVAILGQDGE